MNTEKISFCLKVLSDPKRMQLLDLIRNGTQCNCEFCDSLNLQPNLISHHLHLLKKAELVNIERDVNDSRWIYYTINETTFNELRNYLNKFLNPDSIQPRKAHCGPINESLSFPE